MGAFGPGDRSTEGPEGLVETVRRHWSEAWGVASTSRGAPGPWELGEKHGTPSSLEPC